MKQRVGFILVKYQGFVEVLRGLLGITHLHLVDGKVREEWTVYDQLALLTQIKLGELAGSERR